MSPETATDTATDRVIAAFIGDVKAILATDGDSDVGLERIAARMRQLVMHPVILENAAPAGNVHAGGQTGTIYTDETGLTLVRARFGPEAMTPIHNHGTWGIVGIYRGYDRCQVWRRRDAGDGAGHAEIELIEESVHGPGSALIIPHPPQDIHAQQGEGEATYELVLFGKNAMNIPRLYFDPARKTATLQSLGAH